MSYGYPVASITNCEALFVHRQGVGLEGIALRLRAAPDARQQRYVMLHLTADRAGQAHLGLPRSRRVNLSAAG